LSRRARWIRSGNCKTDNEEEKWLIGGAGIL